MCYSNEERDELAVLLPEEVNGWRPAEDDRIFDPETIFDYIDGAGEVYRAFGFRRLFARHFAKSGQPDIYADVFDMGTSANAFGVFTHDPEGKDVGIGQGSKGQGSLLSFWKDRYFISLFAEEETEESKQALMAIAHEVDRTLERTGPLPLIVSYLPDENRIEGRIHYFFNHLILNFHYFVADENILFLDENTQGALAFYRWADSTYPLLLILYPDVAKTSEAHDNFIQTYMPDAGASDLIQTENGKWTAARVKKNLLIIVFDAPSREEAEKKLGEVRLK